MLAAALPGIRVVTQPAMLPATRAPAPLNHVALLVHSGDSDAATLAAVTTARVAGVRVIAVRGDDPRADPAAIAALSQARPRQVLAIGAGFGPAPGRASRITVAQTRASAARRRWLLFPPRRLVALYGYPGTPALGALGEQGLQASIARARTQRPVPGPSKIPVIPAFEIIATVAEAHPGTDGDYSYESPVASLAPGYARRRRPGCTSPGLAARPGQPARPGQEIPVLLELPDVGLALDAEWKLQPGQLPLSR